MALIKKLDPNLSLKDWKKEVKDLLRSSILSSKSKEIKNKISDLNIEESLKEIDERIKVINSKYDDGKRYTDNVSVLMDVLKSLSENAEELSNLVKEKDEESKRSEYGEFISDIKEMIAAAEELIERLKPLVSEKWSARAEPFAEHVLKVKIKSYQERFIPFSEKTINAAKGVDIISSSDLSNYSSAFKGSKSVKTFEKLKGQMSYLLELFEGTKFQFTADPKSEKEYLKIQKEEAKKAEVRFAKLNRVAEALLEED